MRGASSSSHRCPHRAHPPENSDELNLSAELFRPDFRFPLRQAALQNAHWKHAAHYISGEAELLYAYGTSTAIIHLPTSLSYCQSCAAPHTAAKEANFRSRSAPTMWDATRSLCYTPNVLPSSFPRLSTPSTMKVPYLTKITSTACRRKASRNARSRPSRRSL